jgi:hypothetical protein
MTGFFVDLWADLREKRLWPAAAALLAATVAVPVVLFKPASDAAPPSIAAPHTAKQPTLPVVHVDGGPLLGSHLEAFSNSEKNPFKPMKDLAKSTSPSSSAAPSSSSPSSAGGASTPSGGAGSAGSAGGSGGSGGGSTPSSTGGSTSGGGTRSHTTTTTQWFHYVADFSFGETGSKAKTFKSKAAYTLLPDEKTPVVVFLGLSADHKTALFFLDDPGYDAQGEGNCIGAKSCQFITLSVSQSGDEENFSSLDGSKSYDLQLLKIRRENLGTGATPSSPSTPSTPSSSKKSKTADAATGAGVAAATNSATEAALPAVFVDGPGLALSQTK